MEGKEEETKKRRSFGGKTSGFNSRIERNVQKKHLIAYLKGEKLFRYGRDERGFPLMFNVIENWN